MSIRVDIEGIDFEKSNVIFVNGLTLERVKIKYNWLLNAKVKDAIVGEDDRGIVWYFGDWYCGEWKDGTWYSGNFHSGIWENGLWYSYKLDKFDVLNNKFFIKQKGDTYSYFLNGVWETGTFYGGTFGINSGESWVDYEYYSGGTYPTYRTVSDIVGGNQIYTEKDLATWVDGIFNNGLFYDAIWNNGQHVDGTFTNSKWYSGNWYNGLFDGDTWYSGYWYNGEFINGDWLSGTFTKLKSDVISRFGNTLLDTTGNTAICNWYSGIWKNGEWFSGYVTDSNNNPIESTKNYLSIWHTGTWENGTWYGGHFKQGTWKNGTWYNGIFGYINSTSWNEPELVNMRDDWSGLGDIWSGDTISPSLSTDFTNVTASNTSNTYYEWEYETQNIEIDDFVVDVLNSSITFSQSSTTTFDISVYSSYNNYPVTTNFGYDFVEIDEWNDYKVYIDGVYYSPDTIISGSTEYEWIITFVDWNPVEITSSIGEMKFIIKRKNRLEDGSGSGMTYWSFDKQMRKSVYNLSLVNFIGPIEHKFEIGDFIKIEQEPGYTNENYNTVCYVYNTGITNGEYFITAYLKYGENSLDSGKIVKYLGLYEDREYIQGTPLYFQDFDFDFDFILNTATTLISGYVVQYDTEIECDNCNESSYLYNDVWLPMKGLTAKEFDDGNLVYYSDFDTASYTDVYTAGGSDFPDIIGLKTKDSTIENTAEDDARTSSYGGLGDLWQLEGLQEYYNTSAFDTDSFNPQLVMNANDMRIGIRFAMSGTISQQLRLSNVRMKIFYSNEEEIPTWLNGTWKKGVWYNGDFYDGEYLSGMWLKGNFYNGKMSSDYR